MRHGRKEIHVDGCQVGGPIREFGGIAGSAAMADVGMHGFAVAVHPYQFRRGIIHGFVAGTHAAYPGGIPELSNERGREDDAVSALNVFLTSGNEGFVLARTNHLAVHLGFPIVRGLADHF